LEDEDIDQRSLELVGENRFAERGGSTVGPPERLHRLQRQAIGCQGGQAVGGGGGSRLIAAWIRRGVVTQHAVDRLQQRVVLTATPAHHK